MTLSRFPNSPNHTDIVAVGISEDAPLPRRSKNDRIGVDPDPLLAMLNEHVGTAFRIVAHVKTPHMRLAVFAHKALVSTRIGNLPTSGVNTLVEGKPRHGAYKFSSSSTSGNPPGLVTGIQERSIDLGFYQGLSPAEIQVGAGGLFRTKRLGAQGVLLEVGGTSICFMHARLPSGEGSRCCKKRNAAAQQLFHHMRFGDDRLDLMATVDHCIVMGDLNYRLAVPVHWAAEYRNFLVGRLLSEQNYQQLYRYDELRREMVSGRAFQGFRMPQPRFPPTFKLKPRYGFEYCAQLQSEGDSSMTLQKVTAASPRRAGFQETKTDSKDGESHEPSSDDEEEILDEKTRKISSSSVGARLNLSASAIKAKRKILRPALPAYTDRVSFLPDLSPVVHIWP